LRGNATLGIAKRTSWYPLSFWPLRPLSYAWIFNILLPSIIWRFLWTQQCIISIIDPQWILNGHYPLIAVFINLGDPPNISKDEHSTKLHHHQNNPCPLDGVLEPFITWYCPIFNFTFFQTYLTAPIMVFQLWSDIAFIFESYIQKKQSWFSQDFFLL